MTLVGGFGFSYPTTGHTLSLSAFFFFIIYRLSVQKLGERVKWFLCFFWSLSLLTGQLFLAANILFKRIPLSLISSYLCNGPL